MAGCPLFIACETMHQEDKHMTRPEVEINQQDMWRILVFEQRTTLTLAVETLLRCPLSPERVLRKALSNLEGSPREVTFGQAIHAVIDTTLEYNRKSANSPLPPTTAPPVKLRIPGMLQIAMLPWPERAVYFLRGVLHYSCEETGLLLDLSEVQIDQLYKFAAKRLGYKARPHFVDG
jgi:hypothetical protein